MTTKLSSMPYAQAHIEINNNTITLISYETPVAVINNNWLTIKGLYSRTTRKHIGAFMREYCNSNYQLAKLIYDDDMIYDITTGEIKKRI